MLGLILTVGVFGLVMLAMSVGVLFSGRCLRGSCGGPDMVGPDGELLLCAGCPKRKNREAASDEIPEDVASLVSMGQPHGR